jgi:hypothetical protein
VWANGERMSTDNKIMLEMLRRIAEYIGWIAVFIFFIMVASCQHSCNNVKNFASKHVKVEVKK